MKDPLEVAKNALKNLDNSSNSQKNGRDPLDMAKSIGGNLNNSSNTKKDKNISLTKALIDQLSQGRSPSTGSYLDIPSQVMTGFGDTLQNLGTNIANLIPGVKLPLAQHGEGWPYETGKIIGDIGAFGAGGTALNAARRAAEAIPVIGKVATQLGKGGITAGIERALGNAGYGALTNPDNREQSALVSGGLSAGLDSLFGGLGKLRPSRYFRGELTPEELNKNLRSAEGTKTNLGSVIESPTLKKLFENTLSHLPLSGIPDVMQNTARSIREKGNELLKNMLGGANPDKNVIQEIAKNELTKAREKALRLKNKYFAQSHDLADEVGAVIKSHNIAKASKEELKSIAGDIRNASKYEKSGLADLISLESGKWANPLKKSGSEPSLGDVILKALKIDNPKLHSEVIEELGTRQKRGGEYSTSLRHANLYHGLLNDDITKYANLGNATLERVYTILKKAFEGDIKAGIKASGNTKLQGLNDKAISFYQNEWIPHEDPLVKSFTKGLGDTNTLISKFINTGKDDRSNLLQKITDKLPDSSKKALAHGYFKGAIQDEKLNPLEIKNLYKRLGENQRITLLGSDLNKQMEDYVRLVKMNEEPLSIMANPKTGARNLNWLSGLPSIIGGIGGAGLHGTLGTIAGATAGLTTPGLLTRAILKPYLTSPKTREKFVQAMLGKKNTKLNSTVNWLKQGLIDLTNDKFTGSE